MSSSIASRCLHPRWLSGASALGLAALMLSSTGCFLANGNGEEVEATQTINGATCGVERWDVKTGTDPDATQVNMSLPQTTTVAQLDAIARPATIPLNGRIAPTETTVWVLSNVTLVQYKVEKDSDYHLVLSDGSNTMIAEIPDPACVGSGSPFAAGVQAARSAFDAKYTVSGSWQQANTPVTIMGAGMFDFIHGQNNVAPNGLELHAVLGICFGANCTLAGSGGGGGGNDFSLQLSPATASASAGGSATYSVSTNVVSGSAEAVSLSVSGLPGGVTGTFNPQTVTAGGSSTLTVSVPSGTASGSSAFTVTGSAPSATHALTGTLTVSGGGGGGTNVVTNGGFETGTLSGWSSAANTQAANITTVVHSGSYAARLGSPSGSALTTLIQTVTVPTNGQLSFWYLVTCLDSGQYDWTTVEVLSANGSTVLATPLPPTCTNNGTWVQVQADLSSLAGQTVILSFQNQDDGYPSDPTYTDFDDIQLVGN